MVISKLVFKSSSPVPSEALVLSAINTLRNSRESQLNESVNVVNVTYESKCHHFHLESFEMRLIQTMNNYRVLANLKITISFQTEISETSYAVVFTFNMTIISMPENPELRGNTNQQVQDTINNAGKLKKMNSVKRLRSNASLHQKLMNGLIFLLQLNTLLNEPGSPSLQPKSSNFT